MPLVRSCRNRWCPEYAGPDGWCEAHRQPAFAGHQVPMPPGWAATRAAQLAAFPLCANCGAPATDVHHVHGRKSDELQSLCWRCHATITGREAGSSWP